MRLVKPPRQVFDSFVVIFMITLAAAVAMKFVDQTFYVGFNSGNTDDSSLLRLGIRLGYRNGDRLGNIRDQRSLIGGLGWVPA